MATISLKGSEIHTNGELPSAGSKAPDFVLTDAKLADHRLADFSGKRVLLNVFPSIDTGVCAESTRKFNQHAAEHPQAQIVTVSADLPFALARFCQAEGLDNVHTLSMMRSRDFASDYGVAIVDGPMAGLAARAVVVLDEQGKVLYTELVPEIAQEPDYQKALAALAG